MEGVLLKTFLYFQVLLKYIVLVLFCFNLNILNCAAGETQKRHESSYVTNQSN